MKTSESVMALPQGDVRLLNSHVAQRLLASKELARLAYVAADGTPRVLPMLFHWTGTEVVLSTFGGDKVRALRARPDIAITIDAASTPPEVLLIRGRASVTDVDGIVPEYALATRANEVPALSRRPLLPRRVHAPRRQQRLGIVPDEIDGGHSIALSRPKQLADRLDTYRASTARSRSSAPR
jgi:hypothetical protein